MASHMSSVLFFAAMSSNISNLPAAGQWKQKTEARDKTGLGAGCPK